MSKINYRRPWKVKPRLPVPMKPGKVIESDEVYDRTKAKRRWKKEIEKLLR